MHLALFTYFIMDIWSKFELIWIMIATHDLFRIKWKKLPLLYYKLLQNNLNLNYFKAIGGVKWRFSDSVLLLTCESTTYCDSKKVFICLKSTYGIDFMVQNVEAGICNFNKILKIMTFLLILYQPYLKITITCLLDIKFGYKLVRIMFGLGNFVM